MKSIGEFDEAAAKREQEVKEEARRQEAENKRQRDKEQRGF